VVLTSRHPGGGGQWWRDAVLYHVYCRSFADSNGDGIGDLRGIVDHLDHLSWLGVDAVWLSPTFPSANADWGYDVTDYHDVEPDLGSLDDLDELVARAADRGIRILLDLVPNHTSADHPWFREARGSRRAPRRDWYVWADPRPGGSAPNNWLDFSGAPAWTYDQPSGQYYLHNFLAAQPDLNWWHPEVRRTFDGILRFWFDRGIAGFRIDTANVIVKDRRLRDNPPARPGDHPLVRLHGQRRVFNGQRPEVHAVLRRWRRICERYRPPRLLVGETWFFDLPLLARFYGRHDEGIQLAMNFPFLFAPFQAAALRTVVGDTEAALAPWAWPLWVGSNHDAPRMATRWCGGDPARARCALLILLTLRGTPILYYGDELGMTDVAVAPEAVRDPLGRRGPGRPGRDAARTPMRWSPGANAGFCVAGATPWLPVGEGTGVDVASQRGQPTSTLTLCRDLVALRRASDELRGGRYTLLPGPAETWVWRRGESTVIAVNLGAESRRVDGVHGRVALSTGRDRDGDGVWGAIELVPWEGVVVVGGS